MARKMKDSGIEWIGEIPEEWEVTKLKYLSTFPIEKNARTDSPYIGLENIESWTGKYVSSDSQYDKSQALAFFENNILFGKLRPYLAKVFCASNDGCCSSEFCILNFSSSVNIRYFWNLLISPTFIDHVTKSTYGTKMPRANTDFIKNICVPVPPRIEQDRIALYLDATSAKIDSLISETRSNIEEYKKLKQAVITQAVTKGVRGEREMKDSGVEWIGEIPKEWDILNLVAHTSMLTPMRDRPENLDGPIPWIRIEDFDGKYISSSKASLGVSKETVRSMNLKIYPVGTILCTSSCIMGKCAIVSRELVSNQRFIGIIPDQNTCENFLYYLMLSNSERMNYLATGALQANLSRSSFEHLKVQFPSYQEQKEISDYLDTKCAEIDKLIAKKKQLVKELESYKKSLIYEVVTGKREV